MAFVALSFLAYVASKRAGERAEGTTSSPLRMPVSSLGSAPRMVAPNPNSVQRAHVQWERGVDTHASVLPIR